MTFYVTIDNSVKKKKLQLIIHIGQDNQITQSGLWINLCLLQDWPNGQSILHVV